MFFCNFYIFPTLYWAFSYTFPTVYDCSQPPFVGAVGVEDINGLVQNAKGLVERNSKDT